MGLFELGHFVLHSGAASRWIINCAALTDSDWEALARMAVEVLPPFRRVTSIPRGGDHFAAALQPYTVTGGVHLFADDVLTTGRSFAETMGLLDLGVVVFARGPVPVNVRALFRMPDPSLASDLPDFTGGKIPRTS